MTSKPQQDRQESGVSSIPETETCSRCNVEMGLQPFYEGSKSLCYYCPCCRSRLRSIPILEAEADERAAELGMTRTQFEEHMNAQVERFVRKPTDADLEHARRFAEQRRKEWVPVCPHETENPWR